MNSFDEPHKWDDSSRKYRPQLEIPQVYKRVKYVALWSQKNIRATVLPLCYSILELTGILVLNRLIDIYVVATKDSSYFTQLISILYSKTCLNRTSLGLKYLFSLDSCLVYTGSNHRHLVDGTVQSVWLRQGFGLLRDWHTVMNRVKFFWLIMTCLLYWYNT